MYLYDVGSGTCRTHGSFVFIALPNTEALWAIIVVVIHTSTTSLLVACQGDVFRKLNQTFLLVDSFNFNFVVKEHSDIHISNEIARKDVLLFWWYT